VQRNKGEGARQRVLSAAAILGEARVYAIWQPTMYTPMNKMPRRRRWSGSRPVRHVHAVHCGVFAKASKGNAVRHVPCNATANARHAVGGGGWGGGGGGWGCVRAWHCPFLPVEL